MYEEWKGRLLKLSETRVWRTYQGGAVIDRWRGKEEEKVDNFPEDWVASTVKATNPGREEIPEGYSRVLNIPEQPMLKEVLEAQPEHYFGEKHLNVLGDTARMLIKLIDSYERLTIQVHPDKKFAKEVFHSDYGKTESWFILDAVTIEGEEPCVYFGFKPHVTKELWREIFDAQDIPRMLDCLHRIPVKSGDSFFIPGGLPHAIGRGCFLAEVQEPTDYTMRTELVTPAGLRIHENQCHQGCGYDVMMDCFHYDGATLEETCDQWKISPVTQQEEEGGLVQSYVDQRFTDLFQMRVVKVYSKLTLAATGQLRTWIVLKGSGSYTSEVETVSLNQSDFILIPATLGGITLEGSDLEIIECLPKKV